VMSELGKRAKEKMNKLRGTTPGMRSNYYADREHKCIVRKKPKEKLSKKERLRRRWAEKDRF